MAVEYSKVNRPISTKVDDPSKEGKFGSLGETELKEKRYVKEFPKYNHLLSCGGGVCIQ